MMPGIDERREVADGLRNIDTSDEPLNAALMLVGIKRAIGTFEVRKGWPTYESCLADNERTLNRLADLIEPLPERTCRNTVGEPFAGYREFGCSECGAHLEVDGDTDANLLVGGERPMPNYCPNCGAKVEVGK